MTHLPASRRSAKEVMAGDRITRIEMFEFDALGEALARFEELSAARPT